MIFQLKYALPPSSLLPIINTDQRSQIYTKLLTPPNRQSQTTSTLCKHTRAHHNKITIQQTCLLSACKTSLTPAPFSPAHSSTITTSSNAATSTTTLPWSVLLSITTQLLKLTTSNTLAPPPSATPIALANNTWLPSNKAQSRSKH